MLVWFVDVDENAVMDDWRAYFQVKAPHLLATLLPSIARVITQQRSRETDLVAVTRVLRSADTNGA